MQCAAAFDRVGSVGRPSWVPLAILLQVALVVWLMRAPVANDRMAAAWLPRLLLLQHAGAHALLAVVFGATLRNGRQPLIERIAVRLHHVTPEAQAYIRRLTVAWTVYFAAVAVASCAVFAAAEVAHWVVFAEVGTPLLLATMFLGEHRLRYRWHPEFERVGLRDAVRAYRQRGTTSPLS